LLALIIHLFYKIASIASKTEYFANLVAKRGELIII
jgi:hypothetical protein